MKGCEDRFALGEAEDGNFGTGSICVYRLGMMYLFQTTNILGEEKMDIWDSV